MSIAVLCTGGTIDKIYFDAASEFKIGEPYIGEMLRLANVDFDYTVTSVLKKDSLDMTDADRQQLLHAVAAQTSQHIVVTHGTDTMVQSAKVLAAVTDKTIVLVGAMQPARMRDTDAPFNLGFACAAAQLLPAGVYLAMNGQIFDPFAVQKNRAAAKFEATD